MTIVIIIAYYASVFCISFAIGYLIQRILINRQIRRIYEDLEM